jgi:hypothetical protein
MKIIRTLPQLVLPCLVASFAVLFSVSAMAQYIWLDASGRKVFSDQPPPTNIPTKRILKDPGKPAASSEPATTNSNDVAAKTTEEMDPNDPKNKAIAAAKEASGKATEAVKKSGTKDKDLEAAKKKIDDEAAAKKKTEEEARKLAKADNCQRAKQGKMQFETGRPMATVNAKGERIVMDEAARMVETKRLEGIISVDCK